MIQDTNCRSRERASIPPEDRVVLLRPVDAALLTRILFDLRRESAALGVEGGRHSGLNQRRAHAS